MAEIVGPCPLCGRELIEGKSINKHHMIPRTFGGRESVWMHRVCHGKIHAVFTERELLQHYHTPERLLEHPEVQKFVRWIRRKDPEYVTKHRESGRKRR